MDFSPFSLLGEGLGMRACESKEAIFLCSVNGEWHSKTKTSIGPTPSKPSPDPLPTGEGDKRRLWGQPDMKLRFTINDENLGSHFHLFTTT
jgi:hypothetical protein